MTQPVITVITPTYNRAPLLPRVWDSLKRQTEARFEWIIVDDGSTDATRSLVASFDDPRILYVHQPNRGQNAARQHGETFMRSDYAVFLDSDDELFDRETLRMMLDVIRETPEDIGVAAFQVVTPNGGAGASDFAEDRMVLGYEDLVCECKARGEAFRIFKKKALLFHPWWVEGPGLLNIRYYGIATRFNYLYVARPALIYHTNHGDNLTGPGAYIRRSGAMTEGLKLLIRDHGDCMRKACHPILGAKLYDAAMNSAMAGRSLDAARFAIRSMREKGPIANNSRLLLILLLPLALRHRLFIWRSHRSGIR